jgi:peptidoglycan/LPS O-acetylase OafA/YrhL
MTERPVDRTPRDSLDGLTSLRGIAALAVVGFHATSAAFGGASGAGLALMPRRGYLAVDFFFMLSGFVLMHVYRRQFEQRVELGAAGRFLWARFARIYPVHLFATLLFLEFYGQTPAFSGHALALNLLLLQGPWLGFDSWDIVAWSLSLEWHAYLLFPFLCLAIGKARPAGAILAALIAAASVVLVTAQSANTVAYLQHGPLVLARALPEFVIGMLLYRLYRAGWGRRLWQSAWLFAAASLAILALSAAWPTDILIIALYPVLLLAAATNTGRVRAALAWRPFVFLGEISYSLYMVHIFCLIGLARMIGGGAELRDLSLTTRALALAGGIAVALAMAALVSRCIEYPARAALRRRFVPKPTPLPEAAT